MERFFYRSPSGVKFEFDNEEDRNKYGAPDLVRMTQKEVDEHLSPAPTYSQALAALNAAYKLEVDKFNRSFALAFLSDGPSEASKMAATRTAYEVRRTQHTANIAALKLEYGV
jgi:hypothetical protein